MRVKQDQRKLLETWKDTPEGTKVLFMKRRGEQEHETVTSSPPFMLGGHTACIMLEGVSGAFSLEFVRKASP